MDEVVSDEVAKNWVEWKSRLTALENLAISRSIKQAGCGKIKTSSIHHFSDASEGGYGQSSYLRLKDDQGKIHCVLLIEKPRVSPLKYISIRLKLIAATLSVKVSLLFRRELGIPIKQGIFLDRFQGCSGTQQQQQQKKIKIFVTNKIQFIRENADPKQWIYVPTKENPADDSSED